MSKILTVALLAILSWDLSDIAKVNSLKKEAEEAFIGGNYEEAVEQYAYLLDTMAVEDERATMNYAHAFYKSGNIESSQKQYQKLVLSKDPKIKSLAYQQLGIISSDPETLAQALSYFKESIKSDPTNDDARYNYEMIKKKLKEQEEKGENNDKQDKEDQDKSEDQKDQQDQENQDQKDQDKQDQSEQDQKEEQDKDQQSKEDQEKQKQSDKEKEEQEGKEEEQKEGEQQDEENKAGEEEEQKEQKPGEESKEDEQEGEDKQPPSPSTADKLEEMNISEEKAKMILEALKNSEIQYIQQNRRRPSKQKESDKPDW